MWQYNPTTKSWTWVSGESTVTSTGTYGTTASSSNIPIVRDSAIGWIDTSNNLWLFSGESFNTTSLYNDLWKINLGN